MDWLAAHKPWVGGLPAVDQLAAAIEFAAAGAEEPGGGALTAGLLRLSLASRELWPRTQMHNHSANSRWAAAGRPGSPPCTWADIAGEPAVSADAAAAQLRACAADADRPGARPHNMDCNPTRWP